jgi:membrane associated rhomboid family serine protease
VRQNIKDIDFFKFTPSVWIVPSLLLISIWVVFILDFLFHFNLSFFGILPRTLSGLLGIIFSPFIHADIHHISNNSIALFVLSFALIYFYRAISLKILFFGIILSGFLTWLIGRNSVHIGASGLIYVLASFIFFKGIWSQYFRLVALSFAIVLFYGGMVWYLFPIAEENISWEGHLSGFLTGLFFAYKYKVPNHQGVTTFDWEKPDFNPEEDEFMRNFDEEGNFIVPPKIEEEVPNLEEKREEPTIKYTYIFKEKPND